MSTDTATLRLRSPHDVVNAAPYLLGVGIDESLVVIGMDTATVTVTARLDLADTRPLVYNLDAALGHSGATHTLLLASSDELSPLELAPLLHAVSQQLSMPTTSLWLHGGRVGVTEGPSWWVGEALRTDHRVEAELVGVGRPGPRPRADIVAEYHVPAWQEDRLAQLATGGHAAMTVAGVQAVLQGGPGHGSAALGFARRMKRTADRDEVWLTLEGYDQTQFDVVAGRLLAVAMAVPCRLRVPVLFLHAWACWRSGDGVRTSIALDALDAIDPHYSAAGLLRGALEAGVNPITLPRLDRTDLPGAAHAQPE